MKNNIISQRQQKAASVINNAVVEILRRGKMLDKALIDYPVTITKVIVSPDLKVADCYFFPFNTNLTIQELEQAFEKSKYAIRSMVTDKIRLKYSPEIRFRYDTGFDNATRIEELLSLDSKKS